MTLQGEWLDLPMGVGRGAPLVSLGKLSRAPPTRTSGCLSQQAGEIKTAAANVLLSGEEVAEEGPGSDPSIIKRGTDFTLENSLLFFAGARQEASRLFRVQTRESGDGRTLL